MGRVPKPLEQMALMAPEDVGKVASFDTVGEDWAIIQNTPFRYYELHHEGGICTHLSPTGPKV